MASASTDVIWRPSTKAFAVEKPADGAGGETPRVELPHPASPMSWSADGTHLLFMVADPVTNWDVWRYSFVDRKATPLLNAQESEGFAQFSPDGRWFAYTLHTASNVQLFVESFPRGRGKWQVPSEMAHYQRWRADGRELFFLRPRPDQSGPWAAMAVDVRGAGAGLEFGPPRRLFEAPGIYGGVAGYRGNYLAWAISGDGQRFFLQQPVAAERGTVLHPLVVIMNHPAVGLHE